MRKLFNNTLVAAHPRYTVTFVDNHDSHLSEGDPYVQGWFKPLAYALILLREEGYPCIFLGDYYGIGGDNPQEGMQWIIDQLLDVRRDFAYGDQDDYLDHEHVIGWVRKGDHDHPRVRGHHEQRPRRVKPCSWEQIMPAADGSINWAHRGRGDYWRRRPRVVPG